LYHALTPLLDTYRAALNDPLSDALPEDGKELSGKMMVHLPVGLLGALLATAGSSMLMFIYGARLLRRVRGST
jgi:hypothetical protein